MTQWRSCLTQSYKLHSNTHTIRAPRPDCLLFCLSITWCKLDLMNVREELRQTNPAMVGVSCGSGCLLHLFWTGGDLISLTASKSSVILNIDSKTGSSVWSQWFLQCVGCSVLFFFTLSFTFKVKWSQTNHKFQKHNSKRDGLVKNTRKKKNH